MQSVKQGCILASDLAFESLPGLHPRLDIAPASAARWFPLPERGPLPILNVSIVHAAALFSSLVFARYAALMTLISSTVYLRTLWSDFQGHSTASWPMRAIRPIPVVHGVAGAGDRLSCLLLCVTVGGHQSAGAAQSRRCGSGRHLLRCRSSPTACRWR